MCKISFISWTLAKATGHRSLKNGFYSEIMLHQLCSWMLIELCAVFTLRSRWLSQVGWSMHNHGFGYDLPVLAMRKLQGINRLFVREECLSHICIIKPVNWPSKRLLKGLPGNTNKTGKPLCLCVCVAAWQRICCTAAYWRCTVCSRCTRKDQLSGQMELNTNEAHTQQAQ